MEKTGQRCQQGGFCRPVQCCQAHIQYPNPRFGFPVWETDSHQEGGAGG